MFDCWMFFTEGARYREHLIVKAGILRSDMGLQDCKIVSETKKAVRNMKMKTMRQFWPTNRLLADSRLGMRGKYCSVPSLTRLSMTMILEGEQFNLVV